MNNSNSQPLTWRDHLVLAATPERVLAVAQDFLATWSPEELASLPAACRPPARFAVPEDVVLYTFTLVDYRLKQDSEHPGVFRMANFFSEATARVTFLMGQVKLRQAANSAQLE